MSLKWKMLLIAATALSSLTLGGALRAQEAPTVTRLYVDQKTGEVFIRPGHGRVLMNYVGGGAAVDQQAIDQRIEQKTHEQVQAAVAAQAAQQQAQQAVLAKQVAEMRPAWHNYLDNFQNKFRIGALAYMDYGFYSHTGFGPQFLENMNPPGPGNNAYNSFDISRVYLNTYFTPTKDWNFRFTPEIYRVNGANSSSSTTFLNDKEGANSAFGSNLDGDLNVRMKYAYVQGISLFDKVPLLKGDALTIGAQPNGFINWEEDFSQFRYVYLIPWNYMGFSSSQIGLQLAGPIKFGDTEQTYLDYAAGIYDNGNFHNQEQTNTKQGIGRLTAYPFGSSYKYQGLGLTGAWNYGYGNVTPDQQGLSTPLKGSRAQFDRISAILTYAAEQWNVLGEFDYGKNAFQLGNLFSGSGPGDAFGSPTGTPITTSTSPFGETCGKTTASPPGTPCYNIFDTFGPQTAVYQAMLNNGRTRQLGFDMLGHFHIPGTKLTAFGMYQWLMPNDNVQENPLDFERVVAGLSYQYNEYLRFAIDSQNLLFYHSQFGITPANAAKYNYVPGSKFNGQFLPKTIPDSFNTGGSIPNLVPRDTHVFFLNMEFAY